MNLLSQLVLRSIIQRHWPLLLVGSIVAVAVLPIHHLARPLDVSSIGRVRRLTMFIRVELAAFAVLTILVRHYHSWHRRVKHAVVAVLQVFVLVAERHIHRVQVSALVVVNGHAEMTLRLDLVDGLTCHH